MKRILSLRAAGAAVLAAGAMLVAACSTQVSPLHVSPSATPMRSAGPLVPPPGSATADGAGWASRMIGAPAIDNGGRHLGRLRDVVIDGDTGLVRHVLVAQLHAGGERLVPVPSRLVRATQGEAVFIDVDRRAFLQQPTWRTPNAPTLRASSLLGSTVHNFEGRTLGHIGDVVFDMHRAVVQYAVLYLESAAGVATEHAFAVPLESLDFRGAGPGRIVLDVPHERLAGLVRVDADERWGPRGVRYMGRLDRTFGTAWPRGSAPVGATQ